MDDPKAKIHGFSPRGMDIDRHGVVWMPLASGRDFFTNFTVQYVGSSFSQYENQQPGWGNICTGCPNAANPYAARLDAFGGPLSITSFTFNPELPSYTIGNLRLGLKTDHWQGAFYINNLWDETARLALDYGAIPVREHVFG